MKVNLLIIAPYQGMNAILYDLTENAEDYTADIFTANLSEAVNLVSNMNLNRYDAIVSRGGTAQMLKKVTDIPVYDIGLSGMDVLRAMRLAQNFNQNYAVVGFETITKHAQKLNEVLQYDIPIFTISSMEESEEILKELKREGFQVIACDVVTSHAAYSMSLTPVLITSGYDTIRETIDEAVYFSKHYMSKRQELTLMTCALQNGPAPCTVFDEDGNVVLSGLELNHGEILSYLKEHFAELAAENEIVLERTYKGKLLVISASRAVMKASSYIMVYVRIHEQAEVRRIDAIRTITYSESEETDFSYYNSSHIIGNTFQMLEKYAKTMTPVVIAGEDGTGKDQAAMIIYGKSRFSQAVCCQIDCSRMTDKNWNYLYNSHESPFAYRKRTIYFRHVDAMSREQFERLLSGILDTNLHKRNRLIFSVRKERTEEGKDDKSVFYIQKLTKQITCLSVYLPSIRERVGDIPVLAAYYINRFNLELGKQIVGFDQKSIRAFTQFPWENNLTQFQRLIRELMLITNTSYISYENTMRILRKETSVWNSGTGEYSMELDLSQPLADINYDVIRLVLKEENNNHTNAAERLGISRSTLWRILKQHS